jgi:nitrogen regulatory protein P-II 1
MAFLVVCIVDDPENCTPILNGWERLGVTGVTILESTGLGRLKRAGLRDDLPLMPSMRDLLQGEEVHHRTLLSVVESQSMVDQMVKTAQKILGDLNSRETGFLFVLPVVEVYGLGKDYQNRS